MKDLPTIITTLATTMSISIIGDFGGGGDFGGCGGGDFGGGGGGCGGGGGGDIGCD